MRCIFDASRKGIKNCDSKTKRFFLEVVKFAVGGCKSKPNLMLILIPQHLVCMCSILQCTVYLHILYFVSLMVP